MMIESKVVKLIFCFLLATYYLLPTTYPALAQDPNYDRVNEIAKELNCPTCSGINLADCRTSTCEQWRDQINDLVEQGYSNQEVVDYFTTRYGEQVLQEPPKSGWRLFLWVLPFIGLLVGGVWLWGVIRKWARHEAVSEAVIPSFVSSSADSIPVSGNYLRQVEKDLQNGEW
jgi:cytochrome c-type biogenesis protein CcmH/NrfF